MAQFKHTHRIIYKGGAEGAECALEGETIRFLGGDEVELSSLISLGITLEPLPQPSMKLFIWRNVFCDYHCGIAFAMAPTLEEAMKVLRSDPQFPANYCEGLLTEDGLLDGQPPEIHDGPAGGWVYGGQ